MGLHVARGVNMEYRRNSFCVVMTQHLNSNKAIFLLWRKRNTSWLGTKNIM